MAHQNIGLQVDQLLRERLNSLGICIAPTIIDPDVVAVLPAEFLKRSLKYADALADNCGNTFPNSDVFI